MEEKNVKALSYIASAMAGNNEKYQQDRKKVAQICDYVNENDLTGHPLLGFIMSTMAIHLDNKDESFFASFELVYRVLRSEQFYKDFLARNETMIQKTFEAMIEDKTDA